MLILLALAQTSSYNAIASGHPCFPMLVHFNVRNFRSIADTSLTLLQSDESASDSTDNRIYHITTKTNQGDTLHTSPLMAIYGRNASGKSNLILALCQLQKIILSGNVADLYEPNKIQVAESGRTEFTIIYTCPGTASVCSHLFTYTLEYGEQGIHRETLYLNKEIVFSVNNDSQERIYSAITNADYDEERLERLRLTECTNENHIQMRPVLSWLATRYTNLSPLVFSAYSFFKNHLYTRSARNVNMQNAFQTLIQTWPDNDDRNKVIETISTYLAQLDTGITGIRRKTSEQVIEPDTDFPQRVTQFWFGSGGVRRKGNTLIHERYFAKHANAQNEEITFPIDEESDGTLLLFALLVLIIKTTQTDDNVLVLDEIDRSLHPLLLRQIVNFFIKPHLNENRSQIIFTVHDTELLADGLLLPAEVAVMDKNIRQGSRLKKLSNFAAVTPQLIRKEYLEGQYSGIPLAHI